MSVEWAVCVVVAVGHELAIGFGAVTMSIDLLDGDWSG